MNTSLIRPFLIACLILLAVVPLTTNAKSPRASSKFTSPCKCTGKCKGSYRWEQKTDTESVPASGVRKLTFADITSWAGPAVKPDTNAVREGKETEWYSLTGKVVSAKVEVDGDVHLKLIDENGPSNGTTVDVEVPYGQSWCDIRTTIWGWRKKDSTIKVTSSAKLSLKSYPTVTVVGHAFYDGAHVGTPKHPLLRQDDPTPTAIWELHPVMSLDVN